MIGVDAFQIRETLVGRNFGTNWNLIVLGTILFGISGWLGVVYGLQFNHLNSATRMGIPELSRSVARETLVVDDFYGVVRHPIYCFPIVYGIAHALIVNCSGIYILFGTAVPVLYAITMLEERELIDRFGEFYRKYRQEVPRLLPHPRRLFDFR